MGTKCGCRNTEGQLVNIRVGQGFDIHRFNTEPTPGRALILGGEVFDGMRSLVGHSDADVISHAVADALLGAAGLGDIGQHFPDTDARWKNANSLELLAEVARMVAAAGWTIGTSIAAWCVKSPSWPHVVKLCNAMSALQQEHLSLLKAAVQRVLVRSGALKELPAGQ